VLDILIITDIVPMMEGRGSQRRIESLVSHLAAGSFRCGVHFVHGPDLGKLDPSRLGSSVCISAGFPYSRFGLSRGTVWLLRLASAARWPWRLRSALRKVLMAWLRRRVRRYESAWLAMVNPLKLANPSIDIEYLHSFLTPLDIISGLGVIRQERPKVVILEFLRTIHMALAIASLGKRRPTVLVDTLDILGEKLRGFDAHGLPPPRGLPIMIDVDTEVALAGLADYVLAIQREDATFFRQPLGDARVLTVPHAHPLERLVPRVGLGRNVLFVGADYEPNAQGITEFITTGWPLVRQRLGAQCRLRVVGTVSRLLGGSARKNGVDIVGYVPDLKQEYAQADIVIAPLFFGSGLKIKIVEALCHGRPVVTTPCGAKGLPLAATGEPFIVVADVLGMAAAVVELAQDDDRRATASNAAYRYAGDHFSDAACYRELDALLGRLLAGEDFRSGANGRAQAESERGPVAA
jgi:glycosyltransferase involved in cell wall biosynthesis